MKNIYSALAIAAILSLCSCNKDIEPTSNDDGIHMSLDVTKAVDGGDDNFNENKIQTVHYYFFDKTGTFVYDNTQVINKTGEADFSLSGINSSVFSGIFSERAELDVLVVANATTPDGTSTTTKDDILSTAASLSGFGKQNSFLMVGEGTLTKTGATTAETSDIQLERLASKITLHLIIPDSYIDGASKEWLPQLNSVQIDFKYLGKNTLLSGEAASSPVGGNVTRKSANSDFTFEDAYDETVSPKVYVGQDLSLKVPVYSYPREWSNGDDDTPYIYITIPWKMSDETTTADTYYKILLPGTTLEMNTWYDITAKLGGLGSLVKEGTTTIEDLSINVSKDWKDAIPDHNNTDADLAMPRVLAVEKNNYIIYNQNSIVIPFVSSHNCSASSITITDKSHPDDMGAQQTSTVIVNNEDRTITFTHNLLNDQSSKPYDYLIYKAHFTLTHTDDSNYFEEIYIEQHPALCVEAFNNANGFRNVFVNGTQEMATSTAYNSGMWSILRGGTTNPNVLQVTASVLTGGFADYNIGDPRIRTNSMSSTPFSSASNPTFALDINGKSLTYYYTAGASTSNLIAPSFRISSSYGGTGSTNFDANQYYPYYQLRCAAYQEAGYPAGRWRLPTDAELKYCLQLQADGCLGNGIFNDSGSETPTYYISASGNYYGIKTVNGVKSIAGPVTSGTNIRCVYDAWYWDNTSFPRLPENQYLYDVCGTTNTNYKFVWGDAPISW